MIEVMDQLSPVILESFVNVVVSDTVSCLMKLVQPHDNSCKMFGKSGALLSYLICKN